MFPRAPRLVPFRVSPQHPLVSSLVSRGNSVEISWFGPKISKSGKLPANSPTRSAPISNKSRVLSLVTYIPGNYPATGWVFCRFPRFRLRFCPTQTAPRPALKQKFGIAKNLSLYLPALRLRETRELPEWSTTHPLVSLEISGNAKCWGPSRFLFGFRKPGYRPTCLL